MSLSYVAEQDRVLMRVSTTDKQELRFWMTRRFMLNVMPHFDRLLIEAGERSEPMQSMSQQAKRAAADFHRDEHLESTDFKTPYQADGYRQPLGAEPLLVTEAQITPISAQQIRLRFVESLQAHENPRFCELNLSPQLGHGLLHLARQAMRAGEWLAPQDHAADIADQVAAVNRVLN